MLRALYRLYHPLVGGPDGTGWPFGRSVQSHEVHAALARIAGVDMSREVSVALFPAEPDTGQRAARGAAARPARPRAGLLLRAPGPGAADEGHACAGLPQPAAAGRHPAGAAARRTRSPSGCARASTRCSRRCCSAWTAFSAYLDLATAPEDMVAWLATWLGMTRRPARRAGRPARAAAVLAASCTPAAAPAAGWSWPCRPSSAYPSRWWRPAPPPGRASRRRPARRPGARGRGGRPPAGGSGCRGGAAGRAGPGDQAGPRPAPGAGRSRVERAGALTQAPGPTNLGQ